MNLLVVVLKGVQETLEDEMTIKRPNGSNCKACFLHANKANGVPIGVIINYSELMITWQLSITLLR